MEGGGGGLGRGGGRGSGLPLENHKSQMAICFLRKTGTGTELDPFGSCCFSGRCVRPSVRYDDDLKENLVITGPRGYKLFFTCSSQLSTKFILLINVRMPTFVGILTFISTINTTFERFEGRKFLICWYFSFMSS